MSNLDVRKKSSCVSQPTHSLFLSSFLSKAGFGLGPSDGRAAEQSPVLSGKIEGRAWSGLSSSQFSNYSGDISISFVVTV